jgi:hypothetical protein
MIGHAHTRLAALLCASALLAAAGPEPDAATRSSAASRPEVDQNWDFVQLSGSEGAQGNTRTYTIAGAGSITASVSATSPISEVYSKGFAEQVDDDERGLGMCQDRGPNGGCASDEFEIGDATETGTFASLYLDFTGLVAGSSVTSVTLSSLEAGDGWSVSASTDGSTYSRFSTGVSTSETAMTIPVPAGTKYLRFDVGAGTSGANNYLVASVTTSGSPWR